MNSGHPVYLKEFRDLSRLTYWTQGPVENKQARLVFGTRDGAPRITVYTGVQGKEGIIAFPMDVSTLGYFTTRLKEIAESPTGKTMEKIQSLTSKYENDKRTNEKRLVSELYFGKDDKGMMFMSVTEPNKPKIVFEIRASEWHEFYNSSGEKISQQDLSKGFAIGMAGILSTAISVMIVRHSEEEGSERANKAPGAPASTTYDRGEAKINYDEELGF